MGRSAERTAAVGLVSLCVAGCALALDFDAFDTRRMPPPAADAASDVVDFVVTAGDLGEGVGLSIRQGSEGTLAVRVERRQGFAGSVVISVPEPPPGLRASIVTIAAGETSGVITLGLDTTPAVGARLPVVVVGENGAVRNAAPPVVVRVSGAPGTPDTTFGTGGFVEISTDALLTPLGLVVQKDGKLVAGYLASADYPRQRIHLARFDANGAPDRQFGASGVFELEAELAPVGRIALLADDRLALALTHSGTSGRSTMRVLFLDRDGHLEDGSRDGGVPRSELPEANDVASRGERGWLVLGDVRDLFSERYTRVLALGRDGASDGAFGDGGVVELGSGWGQSLAVAGGGAALALVMPGEPVATPGLTAGRIVRISESGAIDPTFGAGGSIAVRSCLSCFGTLATHAEGFVAAVVDNDERRLSFARFDARGAVDPAFGAGGKLVLDNASPETSIGGPLALAVAPDRSILAGGAGGVLRVLPSGTEDPSFPRLRLPEPMSGATFDVRAIATDDRDGMLLLLTGSHRMRVSRYWR